MRTLKLLAAAGAFFVGDALVRAAQKLAPECFLDTSWEPNGPGDETPKEVVGVEISPAAREMIEEGSRYSSRPIPKQAEPLAGSAAARARVR